MGGDLLADQPRRRLMEFSLLGIVVLILVILLIVYLVRRVR